MPDAPVQRVAPSLLRRNGDEARDAAGFVLAGGQSSRMGRDKALLPFAGRPLVRHALSILHEAGLPASIAGARSPALSEFAPVVSDPTPGLGPLAGICAALASTQSRFAVFLPVDLPFLPPSLLLYLLHHARVSGQVVNLPRVNGFAQTFPAVLDCAVLHVLKVELDAGRNGCFSAFEAAAAAMKQTISSIPVEYLVQAGQAAHPFALPPFRWFLNLNKPTDLTLAEGLLAQRIA